MGGREPDPVCANLTVSPITELRIGSPPAEAVGIITALLDNARVQDGQCLVVPLS
jgi:hypothetical protein